MSGKRRQCEKGKIFIGGLCWKTTDEKLREYFSRFGEIVDCVVMRNVATQESRGFGFVTFRDPQCVELVLYNGPHELDGKIVDPKICNPRGTKVNRERAKSNDKLKVFLGGLPATTTQTELKTFFEPYGKVECKHAEPRQKMANQQRFSAQEPEAGDVGGWGFLNSQAAVPPNVGMGVESTNFGGGPLSGAYPNTWTTAQGTYFPSGMYMGNSTGNPCISYGIPPKYGQQSYPAYSQCYPDYGISGASAAAVPQTLAPVQPICSQGAPTAGTSETQAAGINKVLASAYSAVGGNVGNSTLDVNSSGNKFPHTHQNRFHPYGRV